MNAQCKMQNAKLLYALTRIYLNCDRIVKAIPHKERAESCVVPRKRGTADIFVRLAKFDAVLLTQVKENLVKMTE